MEPLKIYRWATWSLLALNVAVLAFFLLLPPPPPGGGLGGKPGQAPDALALDPDQQAAFAQLVEQHSTTVRLLRQQQNELLQAYFAPLTQGNHDGGLPASPPALIAIEQEKVAATYQHFLDVEGLLHPEQAAAFPEFVQRALSNIFEKRGKRRPPNEGKPRD